VTGRPLSDQELVALCRGGDEDAWRALVERFSRYVYAITVQVYHLPEHRADDVFQEVFSRVYERLDQLRDDAAVRPWIAQLTRRLCLDQIREDAREAPIADPEPEEVEDTLAQVDEAYTVHQMLAELSEDCREVLDRFFARDESYRTIGDQLGIPPGTIASRISRCLGKLRTHLEGRIETPNESRAQAIR
jgi:RNA polymerase sigma factor (sigma-70 family)